MQFVLLWVLLSPRSLPRATAAGVEGAKRRLKLGLAALLTTQANRPAAPPTLHLQVAHHRLRHAVANPALEAEADGGQQVTLEQVQRQAHQRLALLQSEEEEPRGVSGTGPGRLTLIQLVLVEAAGLPCRDWLEGTTAARWCGILGGRAARWCGILGRRAVQEGRSRGKAEQCRRGRAGHLQATWQECQVLRGLLGGACTDGAQRGFNGSSARLAAAGRPLKEQLLEGGLVAPHGIPGDEGVGGAAAGRGGVGGLALATAGSGLDRGSPGGEEGLGRQLGQRCHGLQACPSQNGQHGDRAGRRAGGRVHGQAGGEECVCSRPTSCAAGSAGPAGPPPAQQDPPPAPSLCAAPPPRSPAAAPPPRRPWRRRAPPRQLAPGSSQAESCPAFRPLTWGHMSSQQREQRQARQLANSLCTIPARVTDENPTP